MSQLHEFAECKIENGYACFKLANMPMFAQFIYAMQKSRKYLLEIKEYRKPRTLDANAYCWALIGKMADILRTEKDAVYLTMLERYGQSFVVKIPNKSREMFLRQYPYVKQHETLPEEEHAQYYRVWLGSSNYSTKEMAILIDGIISECKELDIPTDTPEQIARLKQEWKA